MENGKLHGESLKTPQIQNLEKITPAEAREYVEFVALVRHNQRRYFATRRPEVLELCRRLERELDELNERLLDKQLSLF